MNDKGTDVSLGIGVSLGNDKYALRVVFLQGHGCSGGLLQNTSCVLSFGQPKKSCSILLPAKLVWLLFWDVEKEWLASGARPAMFKSE